MKKIKIFLASSIVEFSSERMILENFIRNISDKFEETYNIKIQPLLCENFDDAYTVVRKQEEYNEKIRDSELCFFIFFTKVGEYTREEFNVAREQFEKTGSPKIYTYFKVIEDGTGEDSLYAFMNELDKLFGHYYGTFSHIDTVKLRILLSLKLKEMDFLEIKADNGSCVVDGTKIMALDNVAEFANNEELKKLTKELEAVETEYYKLKPMYEKGNNDTEFYKKYSTLASHRQYLMDEIDELQKLIFNVSLRMVVDDAHGNITERQRNAYRLFEKGDYEGCMAVLNSKDIDSDFLRDMKRLEEQRLTVCRKYIREHKTAIEILSSMKAYAKRFEEIEERYSKIIPIIFEVKSDFEIARAYISYLIDQNKDFKAIPIAEQLFSLCDKISDKAHAACMLGIIKDNLNQPLDAEIYYVKALTLAEQLTKVDSFRFNLELATIYNNAGSFYHRQEKPHSAETYYKKVSNLLVLLAKDNPKRFSSVLATSYNNMGVFYSEHNQAQESEAFYLKAIELREQLSAENPEKFNPDILGSYNNIGTYYTGQGLRDKAATYYNKAIKLSEQLTNENPERFSADLAEIYNNAGILYTNYGQLDIAEGYYSKALTLCIQLAKTNPEKFNSTLSTSYNNAGSFYCKKEQFDKAEDYYLKSIRIREQLVKENPERFNSDLAQSYSNIGAFYDGKKQAQNAEEYYLKVITIREDLAKENPKKIHVGACNKL